MNDAILLKRKSQRILHAAAAAAAKAEANPAADAARKTDAADYIKQYIYTDLCIYKYNIYLCYMKDYIAAIRVDRVGRGV